MNYLFISINILYMNLARSFSIVSFTSFTTSTMSRLKMILKLSIVKDLKRPLRMIPKVRRLLLKMINVIK